MPYNPEQEVFYQSPSTIVDSTPDADSVQEGFDKRATPAIAGLYADMNTLKSAGMISVGIAATETARGIVRVATAAEAVSGVTGANGPAAITPEQLRTSVDKVRGYISEYRDFFENTPPTGWAVRNGAVLANANTAYPTLWEYLHTSENAWKCKTLAQWNSLSSVAGGVGGVPFFVVDDAARTIKLPDTRGDYTRNAGSSYLQDVGGWHADAIRDITGALPGVVNSQGTYPCSGMFEALSAYGIALLDGSFHHSSWRGVSSSASRVVPTANDNRTRTYAMLGCVYVGTPM